jgi:hypothetical protein
MKPRSVFATIFVLSMLILFMFVSASLAQYQAMQVSGGGTITGIVKWSGTAPKPVVLPITKNPDICDPQKKKDRDLERLIVGPDGGVQNTVVFLKNISKGKAMDTLPPARHQLNQKTCRYEPHIYLVPKESNFEMKSSDPILHNIHMVGAAFYNIPFPIPDKVISRSMHKDGVVDVKCDAGHVWMNSEILVVDHPYYAVTDEHGNFKLTDVPAGDYEIEAWHEGWHVAREETMTDVDTHQEVRRPIFTAPMTWDKKVTVSGGGTAKVDFQISE